MKLLKAFSKYAVGTFIVLIIGFVTTPILTRMISTLDMGRYSMFITLGNLIFTLLCLGMDQSYLRFYNEEKTENRNYLLKICLRLPIAIFFLSGSILLLFNKQLSEYIYGKQSFGIALLFVIYIGALIFDRFWTLKIQMAQREIAYSVLNIIRKLMYLVAGVFLITLSVWENSISLMLAITIAEIFVLIFARFIDRGNWKCKIKGINTSYKKLLKYGFPFAFSSTITLIFHSTDKIMLKAFSDYHNIGIYSGAQSIVNMLAQAQAVFVAFWIPTAYEHYSNHKEDKTFYVTMNKIVSYVMLMSLIGLVCFKDIIVLLLGESYRDATYVFPFLAFMPVMSTISETTVMGINFKQKTSYHIYISIISMITNIIGNYFFITWFGATGAAISTGLSYGVFFVLRTYFAQKVFPIPFALKRYAVAVILVYFLEIYGSFYCVNGILLMLALIISSIITSLYKDIIIVGYKILQEKCKKKRE